MDIYVIFVLGAGPAIGVVLGLIQGYGQRRYEIDQRRRAGLRLEAQAWAITEEWTPCPRCKGPMRPGEKKCETC